MILAMNNGSSLVPGKNSLVLVRFCGTKDPRNHWFHQLVPISNTGHDVPCIKWVNENTEPTKFTKLCSILFRKRNMESL